MSQRVFVEEDIWLRPAGVRGRDETSTREREREASISHPSSSGACVTVGRSVSPSFVQVLARLSEDLSWPAAAAAVWGPGSTPPVWMTGWRTFRNVRILAPLCYS